MGLFLFRTANLFRNIPAILIKLLLALLAIKLFIFGLDAYAEHKDSMESGDNNSSCHEYQGKAKVKCIFDHIEDID
jgi:hypothetical protein